MAIFDALKKKKTDASPKEADKNEKLSVSSPVEKKSKSSKKEKTASGMQDNTNILRRIRITEKATMLSENKVYTFEVQKRANKPEIIKAIKEIYNVEPIKVNIVNLPSKRVMSRGKRGVKSGVKKAMVYLKEGDSIEFV